MELTDRIDPLDFDEFLRHDVASLALQEVSGRADTRRGDSKRSR